MIFIKPEQSQAIWIPKHEKVDTYSMTLILKHKLSENEYEFPDLIDSGRNSGYIIFINMDFSQLESGEYEYKLLDVNRKTKERGLLQVMTKLKDPISYKKDKKTIIYGNK